MTEPGSAERSQRRWQGHPGLSLLLRAAIFVVPLMASLGVATLVRALLPQPNGAIQTAGWWIAFLIPSFLALLGVERLGRRLLPLVMLLELSMLFPDKAPSRLEMARRAGRVRDLKHRFEEARQKGLHDEPTEAAENILLLIGALAKHDRRTRGHSERVRAFVDMLAEELKVSQQDRDLLRWSAILHDIGKLNVPGEILNKAARPSESEWERLRRHPIEGKRLAAPLLGWLGEWAGAIEHHHEKFDGTGYPHGLVGRQISLAGRIVAVADSYEVMTAARAYKKPMSAAAAREELARCAGTHFDPMVVRAFLNISLGKLWRKVGPLAWVASLPFLPRPTFEVARAAQNVALGTASAITVVAVGLGAPPADLPTTAPIAAVQRASVRPPQVMGVRIENRAVAMTPDPIVLNQAAVASLPAQAAVSAPSRPPVIDAEPVLPVLEAPPPPNDPPARNPDPEPTPTPAPSPTYNNHGECVSKEAQDDADAGRERGRRQREAAHDCPK